ncbi:MAG: catalase [Pseudomonadota bacterium]|nr:catalase [Pseudomonadota bacterium]
MDVFCEPALPTHAAPLPVEPSVNDATFGNWRNAAVEVWQGRNKDKRWEDVAPTCYPPIDVTSFGGKFALKRDLTALTVAFSLISLRGGGRGTHPTGVGARGEVTILPTPNLPEHAFFRPGAVFPCRFRHANGSFTDDAACTLRGASLKLADSDFESPLDILFNTGSQGPLWSLASFIRFSKARRACDPVKGDFEGQARLMDECPAYLMSWIEAVRDAPSSFADVTYFSQVVFPFVGLDGVLRLCRYRLRRPDLEQESGLCDAARQHEVWNMLRKPEDTRPLDYLRQEFTQRVKRGGVEYRLQIQVRDIVPASDTLEVFHLNRPWSEARWPWHDLARIELNEAMDPTEIETTRYSLGHQPEGLGIFRPSSAVDYRSVAWARLFIYQSAQRARLFRAHKATPAHPYA